MRIIVLILVLFSISNSAVAANDVGLDDASLSILKENRKDISVLGTLKFCGRTDLEESISGKIMSSIVDKLPHDSTLVTKSTLLLQVADQQAIGVALGLMLATVSDGERLSLCKLAVSMSGTISGSSKTEH